MNDNRRFGYGLAGLGALPLVLLGDAQTLAEQVLVRICQTSANVLIVAVVLWTITDAGVAAEHHAWARGIVAAAGASVVIYFVSFLFAALLIMGHKAGRHGALRQIGYTMGRVCLYIFLPAIILGILLFAGVWLFGNPQP